MGNWALNSRKSSRVAAWLSSSSRLTSSKPPSSHAFCVYLNSHKVVNSITLLHCPPSGCFPGFVKYFPEVTQLLCSFPAAKASKGNSQKIVYKTCEITWWQRGYIVNFPSEMNACFHGTKTLVKNHKCNLWKTHSLSSYRGCGWCRRGHCEAARSHRVSPLIR